MGEGIKRGEGGTGGQDEGGGGGRFRETTYTRLSPGGPEVTPGVVTRLVGPPRLPSRRPRRVARRTNHRPGMVACLGREPPRPGVVAGHVECEGFVAPLPDEEGEPLSILLSRPPSVSGSSGTRDRTEIDFWWYLHWTECLGKNGTPQRNPGLTLLLPNP